MVRPKRVTTYIRRAMRVIARDDPQRWVRIKEALGNRTAYIQVDEEDFTLQFSGDRLRVRAGRHGRINGSASIDRQTLLDLIEGQCELLDRVYAGRVFLKADAVTLLGIADALTLFVEAAVRLRSLRSIWEAYRTDTEQE